VAHPGYEGPEVTPERRLHLIQALRPEASAGGQHALEVIEVAGQALADIAGIREEDRVARRQGGEPAIGVRGRSGHGGAAGVHDESVALEAGAGDAEGRRL